MISLSKVIKSHRLKTDDKDKVVIGIRPFTFPGEEPDEAVLTEEIETSAGEILAEAHDAADRIKQEALLYKQTLMEEISRERELWEQQREQEYHAAREAGYQDGVQQGQEAGFSQYQEVIGEAKQIVEASKQEFLTKVESSEEMILELGIKVAERILGIQLERNPEEFIHLVKQAVKEVKEYEDIQIHVSPARYEWALNQKEELQSLLNKESNLFIYPNEELNEQDCMIESSFGKIDAGIDSQLNEIRNKLLELLEVEES